MSLKSTDRIPQRSWWPRTPVVAVSFGLWVFAYLALTMGFEPGSPLFWALASRRLLMCLFGACLSISLYRPVIWISGLTPWPRILALFVVSAAATAVYSFVNYAGFNWIAEITPDHMVFWPAFMLTSRLVIWFFVATTAAFMAMTYSDQARDAAVALASARAEGIEAQHKLLRYQLNPHFLFNTLNALHELVLDRQVERAEEMILSLSGFLRRTLDMDPASFVTLEEELGTVSEYLAIEKIRFGARLQFASRVEDVAKRALLPAFILQPLIENAIKHGLSRTSAPLTISVAASVGGGVLTVEVEDDGPAAAEPKRAGRRGLGLSNVSQRLAVTYGGGASIAAGCRPQGGFRVALVLPFAREPANAVTVASSLTHSPRQPTDEDPR